ncbi:MAG TPA: MFS transporter [Candidatus Obscuribacter sp.]|nr:MFS transporter [Candidatus Obscuribacter sp.]MBK9277456.1 MFS transporter [Candidatus Obscuribacter sp.]HMX46352.1 MFS transporter [Candidatus Obscuribacter sp.]HND68310.1 MFS transporter [Candidatus Obscuribacter sp.]HNG76037.1 MFS transporter [Candidatus Obscuribacter sp.]
MNNLLTKEKEGSTIDSAFFAEPPVIATSTIYTLEAAMNATPSLHDFEEDAESLTEDSPAATTAHKPHPWHAFIATWLGGVFDGMDSSIFAIVLFPALSELLHTQSHSVVGQFGSYIIAMFMVGWAVGAVFFGWLADHIGRARTLSITILLYALFTGLCAFAHNWWELGFYRFLVGAGIGGEMGIGAVLLAECWPKRSRVYALSALATSLGVGYILTAGLNLLLAGNWRYLFIAGVIPAFLTVYMRMKLKDSDHFHEMQEKKKEAKSKAHHERSEADHELLSQTFGALLSKENFNKTIIVGCLTSCAIIAWWAVLSWIPAWINQITGAMAVAERSHTMLFKDMGMILSGILGGFMISRFGYKRCMSLTFVLAFVFTVGMFMTFKSFTPWIFPCILGVGFFAHVPFVLLWSYIPELYSTRIRSTAFGVTYNMGRMFAALAALGSGWLIQVFSGSYAMAASTFALIFLVGAVTALFMPTPCGKMIEE